MRSMSIPFAKLEALRTTLNPRVIYGPKFCDCSWHKMLQRDKTPAALGRVASKHMAPFPAAPSTRTVKEVDKTSLVYRKNSRRKASYSNASSPPHRPSWTCALKYSSKAGAPTWSLLRPLSCHCISKMGGLPYTLTQKRVVLYSLLEFGSLGEEQPLRCLEIEP